MAAEGGRTEQTAAPGRPRPDRTGGHDWGAFLKQARRSRGVSQRALARQLGVSQARIAQIETGTSTPQIDTMAAYIAALGGELILRARFSGDSTAPPDRPGHDAPQCRTGTEDAG